LRDARFLSHRPQVDELAALAAAKKRSAAVAADEVPSAAGEAEPRSLAK
jgi:hypothetical protein